jgi:hypothetical protein
VVSSPLAVEAGGGVAVGDVRAAVSPRIIDANPISARPAGVGDLVKD